MISSDKTIDNFEDLLKEAKHYIELQRDYIRFDLVEKLSILLSTILLIFLAAVLCMIGLFYLSFTAVYALTDLTGSLAASYAVIGALFLLLAFCLYRFRKPLILQPVVRFLSHLFLKDPKA